MQFTTTKSDVPAKSGDVKKLPMTWEAAYNMAELCRESCRVAEKLCAKNSEVMEVIHNLTVADMCKCSGSLESLGASNIDDLAKAMDVSVEALNAMDISSFSEKISCMMPDSEVEPAEESLVLAGALIVGWIALLIGSIVAAKKMTKYEVWYLTRDADKVLAEKGNKAMDEVMVACFDAKEFDKQLAGCEKIIDFLNKDPKEIYGDKTKIVDIEKMATNLWASPDSYAATSASSTFADGWGNLHTQVEEWFEGWLENIPKCEMKTLREHGFTKESLVKLTQNLIKMCNDYVTTASAYGNFTEGHYKAKKEISPGFWKSIKLFFTEKKEDREERKQAELILNAKFVACRNLLRGYNACVSMMCSQIFSIALKTEKIVKA